LHRAHAVIGESAAARRCAIAAAARREDLLEARLDLRLAGGDRRRRSALRDTLGHARQVTALLVPDPRELDRQAPRRRGSGGRRADEAERGDRQPEEEDEPRWRDHRHPAKPLDEQTRAVTLLRTRPRQGRRWWALEHAHLLERTGCAQRARLG